MGFINACVVLLFAWEFGIAIRRKWRRRTTFQMAKDQSKQTGKPLMVVGDPDNGAMSKFTGRDYGEGDVTIDITGCPDCKSGVAADIKEYIYAQRDNSYVIFISCTLEYVQSNDFPRLVRKLYQVSGGDLYVVNVEPYCLSAYFYPARLFTREGGPQRVITKCPPGDKSGRFRWFNFESLGFFVSLLARKKKFVTGRKLIKKKWGV